jgi:hypothetical protein
MEGRPVFILSFSLQKNSILKKIYAYKRTCQGIFSGHHPMDRTDEKNGAGFVSLAGICQK